MLCVFYSLLQSENIKDNLTKQSRAIWLFFVDAMKTQMFKKSMGFMSVLSFKVIFRLIYLRYIK